MCRILIVTDDEFLRDLLVAVLTNGKTEVRLARDGLEMREACRRVAFDVVILTRVGEYLKGGKLMRGICSERMGQASVCVVSWQQANETVSCMIDAGVDRFVSLPMNFNQLRRAICDDVNDVWDEYYR